MIDKKEELDVLVKELKEYPVQLNSIYNIIIDFGALVRSFHDVNVTKLISNVIEEKVTGIREELLEQIEEAKVIKCKIKNDIVLLNQYCNMAGVKPIFNGNIDSEDETISFAMSIVGEIFENRKR
jgi:hypothetical protein